LHHNAASFLIPFIRIRYKLILTTHGLFTEEKFHYLKYLYKIFDRLFLRYSSSITTVSKEDLRIVKNLGINKVKFIPNGINIIDRYYPTFENERDYLLFAAGRIHEGKGCHTFISALMAMEYTGRIIVAGDLDHSLKYKKRLLEMARTLKNVRFAGMIKDKNKLYSLIQNSKLFIYPSHAEAMSIMMLEVAALKTPMICCDCQVNRDLFSEDDVLFAEKGNVSDWKYKIDWALNNPNEMDKLAKHAYGKLLSQHSWDIISMQYEEIYKACIR
jgi:glycosyltransferase involved in cell wall biosynthesis